MLGLAFREILGYKDALRLDARRIGYLTALESRFDTALNHLSPSEAQIDYFERNLRDPRRPSQSQRLAEQYRAAKTQRILDNLRELNQDGEFLVKLETEFDDLLRRTTERGPDLVRRSLDRLTAPGKDEDGEGSPSRLVHLVPRTPNGFGSTDRQHQQQWRSIDDMLQSLDMTRDELGAYEIADFLRRGQRLLPSHGIALRHRQELGDLYRSYKQRHPFSGAAVDYEDPATLMYDSTFGSGRNRFRDIEPIIEHMLQNQEALQLNGPRVAFLQAAQARFAQTKAALTPTADDLLERADTEAEREQRLVRWANLDFRQDPPALIDFLWPRLHAEPRHWMRIARDLHFLQHIEIALERCVARVDEESASIHRKKRSLSPSTPAASFKHEHEGVHGGLGASHRVDLHPRSDSDTEDQPGSSEQGRTLEDLAESMGLPAEDPKSVPIARVWHSGEPLFPPVARSQEALQELQRVYGAYQRAHPVRGLAADITENAIHYHQVMRSAGRDRFRDIDDVLNHLLLNAEPLRLDSFRVNYLRALRDRFDLTEQLLTPTQAEIVDGATRRIGAAIAGPSAAENSAAEAIKLVKYFGVRGNVADNNRSRFVLDLTFLSALEEELDHLVRGAGTRMATGMPVSRRDVLQQTPADILQQRVEGSASLGSQQRHGKDETTHKIVRRRLVQSSPQDDPASSAGSAPLTPAHPNLAEQEGLQDGFRERRVDRYLQSNERLLSQIDRAPNHRERLASLYRVYQKAVPLRGRELNLQNSELSVRLMMANIGRDRFKHIEPILEYMVANRDGLLLNRDRHQFLKAASGRFEKMSRLLSPTLDDLREQEQLALRAKERGEMTEAGYQLILRAIDSGKAARSQRALIHASRMLYDLGVINRIERELDDTFGPIEQAGEASSHLVRRGTRLQRRRADEAERPLPEHAPSSRRAVHQRQPADVEMQRILSPLGMDLDDAYARPIAAWRLHEQSLLEGRVLPDFLNVLLRAKWNAYREVFRQLAPFNYGGILSMQDGIRPYINTDEGARFQRIRHVINFLLEHSRRLRLSRHEVDYLDALRNRFRVTEELLHPLPSLLVRSVRATIPDSRPREQLDQLRTHLALRERRIRAETTSSRP
ncbi:uncharacterized protein SRS1_14940 [Sporisorium reilianum f. sp. reilianum]|uniref:Uncharacterized protein n=1 Tax=Sporisorium reilianum f. sp. reilianum TaxID=72559 RepID=A0A2N8UHG9_9BASI|nr:uncharacterized protein SRS1_14940 [Sporisorium reilianum f. sp. reilianum]